MGQLSFERPLRPEREGCQGGSWVVSLEFRGRAWGPALGNVVLGGRLKDEAVQRDCLGVRQEVRAQPSVSRCPGRLVKDRGTTHRWGILATKPERASSRERSSVSKAGLLAALENPWEVSFDFTV